MTWRHALTTAAIALVALGASSATASAALTASFTVSSPHRVGDAVTFKSTSNADPGNGIVDNKWTVDGAVHDTAANDSFTQTFSTAGPHTIKLDVTDNALPTANTATASKTVSIPANQPPAASFTFSPAAPLVGQSVKFTSTSTDPDGTIASVAWDLDNSGVFNDGTTTTVSTTFTTSGPHTVRLKVTDDLGGTNAVASNVVVNVKPTASFTVDPEKPIEGDTVTFTSTSTDPDGTIASTKWDLDGDGAYDDATGATATRKFTVPGSNPVGVRVTDDRGAVATSTMTLVVVANKPPVAVFSVSPDSPVAGQPVTLTSTSSDPDGKVVKTEWDIDGNGTFGDVTGTNVKRSFDAGAHRVSLRVTDDRGATDTTFQTISVRDAPTQTSGNSFTSPGPTVTPAPPRTGPALLSPFPIVSLRGRLVRGGAIIQALEVMQAPRGARVEVRCRGRSCPFRRKVRTSPANNRRVRFREVRHRLRAGVLLQVFITKPGVIGKYTSFKIRGNATPLRRDRCLVPGVRKPMRCAPS